jgi:hypothetical protein
MAPAHLISKAALALAAMVYVDKKYYISKDISEIMTGIKTKNGVLKRQDNQLFDCRYCQESLLLTP